MAHRASWRGALTIAELSLPVALHAAISTAERVSFRIVNRSTGHAVRRVFVDEETGEPVKPDDRVKGYETEPGQHVVLEPDEIAAAVPDQGKSLTVERFVACGAIDEVYLDRPYFLVPGDAHAVEAYAVVREGLRREGVAALARAVLFRRARTVLVRAHGDGLVATTLNFDYEVRPVAEVFRRLADRAIDDEMLELAQHIIATKRGHFDPSAFDDRFEAALAELVRSKVAGRPIRKPSSKEPAKVLDLRDALRRSANAAPRSKRGKPATSEGGLRKAG